MTRQNKLKYSFSYSEKTSLKQTKSKENNFIQISLNINPQLSSNFNSYKNKDLEIIC